MILLAPGYVLQSALLPVPPLPALDRLLISFGGSIVITILVGLLLAWVRIPLVPISWTAALALFTIIGAGLAVLRRRGSKPASPERALPRVRLRDALPIALAGVGIVAIFVGTRTIAGDQEPAAPAQLWLLPAVDGSTGARLGMRAGDGGDYTIRVTSAGVLLQEYAIRLDPEQAWEQHVVLSADDRRQPIVGRLYTDVSETELRFVVLQPLGDPN